MPALGQYRRVAQVHRGQQFLARGIDVGAKQEIYANINELAKQGLAIVLVSSELPEVLGLSDRILVLHEGRLTGEFSKTEATPEKVMAAATGNV